MMHLTAAMAIPAAAMRSATFEGPGAKTIPMPVQRTRRPGSRAFPLLSESTKGKEMRKNKQIERVGVSVKR